MTSTQPADVSTLTAAATVVTPGAARADESRQSALVALGRRAVAASDVLLLMQDAAALLAETLDADFSSVAEVTPDGEWLNIRLCAAKGGQTLNFQTGVSDTESLAGHAIGMGHPVTVVDMTVNTRPADFNLLRHGVRSAVVCPLKLNEKAFGALAVYHADPREFDPSDVLFVETISHLITTTIARERTERQLVSEREFAAAVMETVEALVLVLSPAGRLLQLNRAAERITGFESDEVWDRAVFNVLVVPEEVELTKGALERLKHGQAAVTFDSSILTKQGDRRKISWSYSAQRDARGAIAAILGTGIDITEKTAAEALLAEAQAAANEAQQQTRELTSELEATRNQQAGKPVKELRPFQQLEDTPGAERRAKPRRAYPYVQLIAPMDGKKVPPRNAFEKVLCHDISASGFSFFSARPPLSDMLVVAFGSSSAFTYLKAQVVHCRRTEDGSKFLIGCHYTGRVQY